MSASLLPGGVQLYRSKKMNVFTETPRHGSPAWTFEGGVWSEFRYWNLLPYEAQWVSIEEYQKRKAERKTTNILQFQNNPSLLAEKKRIRRGGVRYSRCCF